MKACNSTFGSKPQAVNTGMLGHEAPKRRFPPIGDKGAKVLQRSARDAPPAWRPGPSRCCQSPGHLTVTFERLEV
jgi:hypothetical protein